MVKKIVKKLKKKLSSKRKKFYFATKAGRKMRLHFRKTFTNMFITLTDRRNQVVYALSAGQCSASNNRREKTAPFVLEVMTNKIISVLKKFKIVFVEIFVKSMLRVHLRILVYRLNLANYLISSVIDRRIAAHNGVRSRALKRR